MHAFLEGACHFVSYIHAFLEGACHLVADVLRRIAISCRSLFGAGHFPGAGHFSTGDFRSVIHAFPEHAGDFSSAIHVFSGRAGDFSS